MITPNLTGRRALLSGCDAGVGLEVASSLMRSGAQIFAASPQDSSFGEKLKGQTDSIDILIISAAALSPVNSFEEYDLQKVEQSIWEGAGSLLRHLQGIVATFKRYPQYVVVLSSHSTEQFYPGADFTAMSHSMLEAMVRYLSYRLLAHRTKINLIRVRERVRGAPVNHSEAADAVLALCSGWLDAMNGQAILVDRGESFGDNPMGLFERRAQFGL